MAVICEDKKMDKNKFQDEVEKRWPDSMGMCFISSITCAVIRYPSLPDFPPLCLRPLSLATPVSRHPSAPSASRWFLRVCALGILAIAVALSAERKKKQVMKRTWINAGFFCTGRT